MSKAEVDSLRQKFEISLRLKVDDYLLLLEVFKFAHICVGTFVELK